MGEKTSLGLEISTKFYMVKNSLAQTAVCKHMIYPFNIAEFFDVCFAFSDTYEMDSSICFVRRIIFSITEHPRAISKLR